MSQEYYFLTLDPSSLISLNYPVRVAPLRNWKSSSFLRVYRVDSRVMRSTAGPRQVTAQPAMTAPLLSFYTRTGGDEQIHALALQVTKGETGYYAKAAAIEKYLKTNYLYSLKPGIAEDGNQLHHFLFVSKKGYCSYFAFAMALMCRSLGIPARVAVGFYVDPQSEVLNFYEVRAFQAHAWVEVYFGDLGWVEFDPTSETLAPGEEFNPVPGPDRDMMARLIAEIVKNQTDQEEQAAAGASRDRSCLADRQGDRADRAPGGAAVVHHAPRALCALSLLRKAPSFPPRAPLAPAAQAREGPLCTLPGAPQRCGVRPQVRRVAAGARAEDLSGRGTSQLVPVVESYLKAAFADRFERRRRGARRGPACKGFSASLRSRVPAARRILGILNPSGRCRGDPEDASRPLGCRGCASLRAVSPRTAPLARPRRETPWRDFTSRAQDAITQNAFESAVKILTEAKTQYPASPKPSLALGDLYYDKELYPLALAEYREAEKKGATDFATLTQISRCYGKLNQEKSSIDYLTRILQQYPDSADTIDDLGWMYFKTHQLDKGEQVLLKGIKKLGLQRGMAMTLGTVYSGMNRYDQSREYYLKSVDEALRVGDREFAAIAYYNLSLLEHNFFHYNSALRFTDESIAMEDRPSGHLARGELFQSRMDFAAAEQEYQSAYAKDTTPLSKVNLAILYQKFGRLDLARRYGEQVLGSKDMAWLMYYGTDITRHLKDVHELLAAVEKGLAVREAHRPTTGIVDRITALAASLRHRLLAWYHAQRFHALSLQAGTQYLDQGAYEDAWWQYYRGNESYPEVALQLPGHGAAAGDRAHAPCGAVLHARGGEA